MAAGRVVGLENANRPAWSVARRGAAGGRPPPPRFLCQCWSDPPPCRPRLRDRGWSSDRRRDSHRPDRARSQVCGVPFGGAEVDASNPVLPARYVAAAAKRGRDHARGREGRGSRHRRRAVERHRPRAPAADSGRPSDGRRWAESVPARDPPRGAACFCRRPQAGMGVCVAQPDVGRASGRGGQPNIDRAAASVRKKSVRHAAAARDHDRDLRHWRWGRLAVRHPRQGDQAALGPPRGGAMSKGFVVWFTGLSGAGKSTIAGALQAELARRGRHVELLDGDEVRTHLSKGLGFSKEDRDTNIRRIGYVARLVARSGGVAITAAISPYREVRDELRVETPGFVEVYMRCPIETLTERDTKGLHRKALAGEIANFTGVSDPYEEPLHPEVVCDTASETPGESLAKITAALERLGHLPKRVIERLPSGDELNALRAEARTLPRLDVGQRELSDLFMLASGGLAPLDSFMGADDYASVIAIGRLAAGQPFTIPVALRVASAPKAERIAPFAGEQPIRVVDVA